MSCWLDITERGTGDRPWDAGHDYEGAYRRPCDAPDPECLCDECRAQRGEIPPRGERGER